jgi:HEAT repeat protein
MDVETRRWVVSCIADRNCEVRDGAVRYDEPGVMDDVEELVGYLQLMTEVALRLGLDRANLHERLARNAASDPAPGSRAIAQALLGRHFGAAPAVAAVAPPGTAVGVATPAVDPRVAALHGPDPAAALDAAAALGAHALAVTARLAQTAQLDPTLRARAIEHVVSHAPPEAAIPVLLAAMNDAPGVALCTAIEALGWLRYLPVLPRLAAGAATASVETLQAVASACGLMRDARAEPLLVSLLAHQSPVVRAAAARALATSGTQAALERLHWHATQDQPEVAQVATETLLALQSHAVGG